MLKIFTMGECKMKIKIKINKSGFLEIERAGILKKVHCPFDNDSCECGDWCPLFGEPRYTQEQEVICPDGESQLANIVKLRICQKEFITKEEYFIDERKYNVSE